MIVVMSVVVRSYIYSRYSYSLVVGTFVAAYMALGSRAAAFRPPLRPARPVPRRGP